MIGISTKNTIINRNVRDFRKFDEEAFKNDIRQIDISSYIGSTDINEIFGKYNKNLLAIINKHAPFRKLSRKEMHWKAKPWITPRLQKLISIKHKLYDKYITNRDPFWYNRYTNLRRSLSQKLFNAKKQYYTKFFEENSKKSRKVWEGINELFSNRRKNKSESIYLSENGNIETNQTGVASRFNKYYTNMADNLLKFLGNTNTKYQDYLKNPNENTLFLKETDHGEVLKLLSTLDISKAGDIYDITPKLINCAR